MLDLERPRSPAFSSTFSPRSFISLCFTFRSTDQTDLIFVKTVIAVSIVTFFFFLTFHLVWWRGRGHMHIGSEGNLQGSVFSSHHGERTQNFGIGSKRLYSLSRLTSPRLIFCMRLSRCSSITCCRGDVFPILWLLFFCWRPVDRICVGSASGLGGPFRLFFHQYHNADRCRFRGSLETRKFQSSRITIHLAV